MTYYEVLAYIGAEYFHYPSLLGMTVMDIYDTLPEADERWGDEEAGLQAMLAELEGNLTEIA